MNKAFFLFKFLILSFLRALPIYVRQEAWDKNEYTKAGDVHAFSIIVYEIMTLEERFKDFNMMMCKKVAFENFQHEFNCKIPDCYKDLMIKC